MLTRRAFLRLLQSAVAAGAFAGTWALAEPYWLRVQSYALKPAGWPDGLKLRLAIVADIHACWPWMTPERVDDIVATTQALEPDCILLLGDYVASHSFQTDVPPASWARPLARLSAPLGVHAVLGNHDWWHDPHAVRTRATPVAGKALQDAGLKLYENDVLRLSKDGKPFWLAGLGDQIVFAQNGWRPQEERGVDDLPGTLAKIGDDAPVIMMAHEPDVFARMPDRVALTISGHTHGGQVRLFGRAIVVPSRYGRRYAYGHIVERDRDLIVSGGLGCSMAPIRFGMPPEVVVVEVG